MSADEKQYVIDYLKIFVILNNGIPKNGLKNWIMRDEKLSNIILTELASLCKFSYEDIVEVEEDCSSIFVKLKNGDVYILSLTKTENE